MYRFLTVVFLGAQSCLLSYSAFAQNIIGSTSVVADQNTGNVTATCETDLDSDAQNYYEAEVRCFLADDTGKQVGYSQFIDNNGVRGYAQTVVTIQGVMGTTYTATGQHLAIASLGDYAQPAPGQPTSYLYEDPYNFGIFESGPLMDFPGLWDWFGPGPPQERRANSIRTGDTSDQQSLRGNFNIGYSAYIPVDHVQGPSVCAISINGNPVSTTYVYMGDAGRGTYRTTETLTIVPARAKNLGDFFPDTGYTRQYGYGSPAAGANLSSADEDGIANDCHLWNAQGKAIPSFTYSQSYDMTKKTGLVIFNASSTNPLEPSAPIMWDISTTIDTSHAGHPTATVSYSHTCYPAHQVKVNGATIYSYTPPSNSLLYITNCLKFGLNPVTGSTSAVQVMAQ